MSNPIRPFSKLKNPAYCCYKLAKDNCRSSKNCCVKQTVTQHMHASNGQWTQSTDGRRTTTQAQASRTQGVHDLEQRGQDAQTLRLLYRGSLLAQLCNWLVILLSYNITYISAQDTVTRQESALRDLSHLAFVERNNLQCFPVHHHAMAEDDHHLLVLINMTITLSLYLAWSNNGRHQISPPMRIVASIQKNP